MSRTFRYAKINVKELGLSEDTQLLKSEIVSYNCAFVSALDLCSILGFPPVLLVL